MEQPCDSGYGSEEGEADQTDEEYEELADESDFTVVNPVDGNIIDIGDGHLILIAWHVAVS